jgi:hypothetical protein
LGKALGFANSAQRPRLKGYKGDGAPDVKDSRMHANVGDLADARLRSGRPNGGASQVLAKRCFGKQI